MFFKQAKIVILDMAKVAPKKDVNQIAKSVVDRLTGSEPVKKPVVRKIAKKKKS